jgi:hypothetical protein
MEQQSDSPALAAARSAASAAPSLLDFEPVRLRYRSDGWTPARQRAFIAALAETGIVTQAALEIGASLEALYKLRNRPGAEEFRAAWDAAIDRGIARLEDCALARAIQGEERMVVSAGKLLGFETRYNDALTMFFLRARRGNRYAPDWRTLRPGNPLYEKIRAEAIEAYEASQPSDEETYAEIDAWLDGMRDRRSANEAILSEWKNEDEGADDGADDGD